MPEIQGHCPCDGLTFSSLAQTSGFNLLDDLQKLKKKLNFKEQKLKPGKEKAMKAGLACD